MYHPVNSILRAPTDLTEAYGRFRARYANSELVQGQNAFQAAVQAAGLNGSQVTDEWLRSLQNDWVYGYSDEPFADKASNLAYRELLARLENSD